MPSIKTQDTTRGGPNRTDNPEAGNLGEDQKGKKEQLERDRTVGRESERGQGKGISRGFSTFI